MKLVYLILSIILQLERVSASTVTTADFLNDPIETGAYCYQNYIGVVLNLNEVGPYLNSSLLQGYLLNSNLNMNWGNNFAVTLRMPKGWFYQCSQAGFLANDTTNCVKQLKGNTSFFTNLYYFSNNVLNSPFWTFGINNEKINFDDPTAQASLFDFDNSLFLANNFNSYMIQMMWEGDKAIQNGMKSGASYTSDMFISEAYNYEEIFFGLYYKAPGITETATTDWMTCMDDFYSNVYYGIYTFQSVIFTDPTLATISNLLSDNYTKGYFQRRARVNSSYSYSDFSSTSASISRVRLVDGQGIDGITNTFAAAVWWVDFLVQSAIYSFYDVSIEGASRSGNYQSMLGPPPAFAPTSLYYGSLLASLAFEHSPQLIIPNYTTGTSNKIKVWGFSSSLKMRYLILNKDTNPSLSGSVNIIPKTSNVAKLSCIYMQAPSLTSKADTMKLGGHNFIGGNSTPQGTYSRTYYLFDKSIDGYAVTIKYAQVALCEIQYTTQSAGIPRKSCTSFQNKTYFMSIIFLLAFLWMN